ncbi:hypothetical protein ACFQHO_43225 [Actinomadura yumaensis]|uniref:hypothetical protein n=1 Tax=Actinomadura yumaensis TaxID=111807 RepID=UPI00360E7766
MAERERRWGWMAVPLAAVALWAVTCGKNDPDGDGRSGRPGASGSPTASKTKKLGERDPARFAGDVRRYAKKAGVSARLLMTILYNEADKPHDPELERAWQKFKRDAAFGIANMHRAAFDEAKRGASRTGAGRNCPTTRPSPSRPPPGTCTTSRGRSRPHGPTRTPGTSCWPWATTRVRAT